jgi:hypothetical protein
MFKEEPKTRVSLDIIPYVVSDPRHPDRDDEFQIAVPGEIWYKRPYYMHRGVGPNKDIIVCPTSVGQRCPICEYRQELLDEGTDWNDDSVKALRPSLRNLYVVIPRGHKDYEEVPHIWDISQFLFQNALNEEIGENEEYETFPDPEDGFTLQIRFAEESFGGNKFASVSRIDFVERKKPLDDSIIDQAPDLDKVLVIPSAETVEQIFFGGVGSTSEDSDDDRDDRDNDDDLYVDDEDGDDIPFDKGDEDEDGDDIPFDKGDEDDEESGDVDVADDQEDEKTSEPPPTRTRRARHTKPEPEPEPEPEQSEDECPSGYKFGADVDRYDECDDCPLWEQCMDAHDQL